MLCNELNTNRRAAASSDPLVCDACIPVLKADQHKNSEKRERATREALDKYQQRLQRQPPAVPAAPAVPAIPDAPPLQSKNESEISDTEIARILAEEEAEAERKANNSSALSSSSSSSSSSAEEAAGSQEQQKQWTCSVCLDAYQPGDSDRSPVALECGHSICAGCLRVLTVRKCPMCRRAIVSFVRLFS